MRREKMTIVAMMFATMTVAQFSVGVKTGVNISSIQTAGVTDIISPLAGSFIAPTVGVFGEYKLNSIVDMRLGVNYAQRGTRFGTSTNVNLFDINIPIGASTTIRSKQIEIPLSVNIGMDHGDWRPYATLGTGLAKTTSITLEPEINSIIDINLPTVDIPTSGLNTTTFFGLGGVGLTYKMPNGRLFGEVQYQHSFESIAPDFALDLTLKDKGFSVGIGYAQSF